MKLNKFLSLCAAAVVCVALTGCYKTGAEGFENKIYIGSYKGMKVELIRDETFSSAKGFYLIDYANYDPSASSSENLSNSSVIGEYNNFNVIFVKDSKFTSPAKGFYLFEDKSTGMLAPSVNYTTTHSTGKSSTQYSMATLNSSTFTPSKQDQNKNGTNQVGQLNVQITQSPNQVVQLESMNERQLIELAKMALEVARTKVQQNDSPISKPQNNDFISSPSKSSLIPR